MAVNSTLDRIFVLELVRVTEAAAIAAAKLVGMGDEKAADAAAVESMRNEFNQLDIKGRIVIGEGERDEAPMLYIGEEVGTGNGPEIDIALDPLEGTTIAAKAMQHSLAVVALAEQGNLLTAPDVSMDKIAVGPGLPKGILDLDKTVDENIKDVADAKGRQVSDILVCVLDRPRHGDIIEKVRACGARVKLIGDGDVAGVIDTTNPDTSVDIYMGSGGAPDGVLAAAALRCIGGQIQGRLTFRNDTERGRARKWGIEDLDRKYSTEEMAAGDVIFAATGVTDGTLLRGVHTTVDGKGYTTETVVMRSASKTVRRIQTEHNREIKLT